MKAKLITADGAFRFFHVPPGSHGRWPQVLRFALFRPLKAFRDLRVVTPADLDTMRVRSYEWVAFDEQDGHTLIYKEIVE